MKKVEVVAVTVTMSAVVNATCGWLPRLETGKLGRLEKKFGFVLLLLYCTTAGYHSTYYSYDINTVRVLLYRVLLLNRTFS